MVHIVGIRQMNLRIISSPLLLIFWPLLFCFVYVAGQAGSPQPENWQIMSLLGNFAGWAALACVLGSIGIGVRCAIIKSPVPRSSIVTGFTLLVIIAYILMRTLYA